MHNLSSLRNGSETQDVRYLQIINLHSCPEVWAIVGKTGKLKARLVWNINGPYGSSMSLHWTKVLVSH
jgi:hypothetical protein